MKKAVLIQSRCDRSPFCIVRQVCPVQAITQDTDTAETGYPVIDPQLCVGCERCVSLCPHGAVVME